MRKINHVSATLCGGLLAVATFASPAQASMPCDIAYMPQLPVLQVLGCRLHGMAIVCSPGRLLPKQLHKSKEPYHKGDGQPSNNGPSETTYSSKGDSGGKKGSSDDSNGAKNEATAPATQEGVSGAHACPPGNVVLEKPNAAGSYCDVVGQTGAASDQSDTSAPVLDKVTASPLAAAPSSESQTGNAAGGSAASP